MGRFSQYKPISFDVPEFVPDFAQLREIQDFKQKRLDDFNNQTDMLAASLQSQPGDEAAKQLKIKDIMDKKDLITKELINNPANGTILLKRFQSDLKKDVLSGDIYTMNKRKADYDARMQQIAQSAYGKDPRWKKYHENLLKQSYGDFYTDAGFGKTEGSLDEANFFDEAQKIAFAEDFTKVAMDKYQEAIKKDPTLANVGYGQWFVQEGHAEISYGKVAAAALPKYMSNEALQSYWKREGEVQGLEGDQSQIKIDKDTGEIVQDTLAGKWLAGAINSKIFREDAKSYQNVTDTKAQQDDSQAHALMMQKNAQAFSASENEKGRQHALALKLLDVQAAKDKEAQKNAENKAQLGSMFTVQGNTQPISPTIRAENRKIANDNKMTLMYKMAGYNKEYNEYPGGYDKWKADNPDKYAEFMRTAVEYQAANKALEAADRNINESLDNSTLAPNLVKAGVWDADWKGTNWVNQSLDAAAYREGRANEEWGKGNYFSAIWEGTKAVVNNFSGLTSVPFDMITGLLNLNDHNGEDLERRFPGYKEALTNSVRKGLTFQEFKQTPVGKKMTEYSTFGGETFGVLNSAESHYNAINEAFKTGGVGHLAAFTPTIAYATVPEKIDDKPNGDYQNYNNAVRNSVENGSIKPIGAKNVYEKIAIENGITEPNAIQDFVKNIKIDKVDYGIGLVDANSGYLTVNYTIGKGEKAYSGVLKTETVHNPNSEFDNVYDNESYAIQNNPNHPYKEYYYTERLLKIPSVKVDLEALYSLPKTSDIKSKEERYKGVELVGSIPTNSGKTQSLNGIVIYMLENGNYKIRVPSLEQPGSYNIVPEEFRRPEQAYNFIAERVTKQ